VLVEAVERYDLFAGKPPPGIAEPYSLECGALAAVDA